MKFLSILVLLFTVNASAWETEAVCEVKRINQENEAIATETVREKLVYKIVGTEVYSATAILVPNLAPSYKLEFNNVSGGRSDSLSLRTLRQSNDEVMSTFEAAALFNNSKYVTANSKYTAKAKNIFLSDSDKYVFDISCYENVENN